MTNESGKKLSYLCCRTCTYWNNTGECTRFPPQVTDEPGPPRFPLTAADVFCAEWSQNDDEFEDGVTHGKLSQELIEASVDLVKAWHGSEEEKLEPHIKKLQMVLMKCQAW